MKNVFTNTKSFFLFALLLVLIGSSAWQVKPKSKMPNYQTSTDTIKPQQHGIHKNEPGVKDFDEAMKELEEAMKKLEIEMKNIDMSKIQKEIKEAMSKVDMKKMQAEIKASMASINWEKIREDVDKAMKEAELNMKNIDMNKLQKQMAELEEKLSNQQFNFNIDADKIRQQVEEGMLKAKEGMEKAKAELKFMKEFTDELEKDKLIDQKKGYKVQVKDGELYINGTKQPKEVSDKYRKYFRKDNLTINNNGDSIIEL